MRRLRTAISLALLVVLGCERPEHSLPSPPSATAPRRIISFSPAVTSLLHDMSLERRLVGRSAFCRGVDDLPVVGDLGGADVEGVVRLQPDLLIHQSTIAPPPAGLQEASSMTGAAIVSVSVDDMDDLHEAIDVIHLAADPAGSDAELRTRCDSLHDLLDSAMEPAARRPLNVLLLQPGPALLAWGGRTWLGRVLDAAGATPLLPDRAWVTITAEDVVRLEPDMILVLGEHEDIDPGAAATLPTPARTQGRVHVLAHPQLLIPGVHAAQIRTSIDALLRSESLGPVPGPC